MAVAQNNSPSYYASFYITLMDLYKRFLGGVQINTNFSGI
jgi:hypothetical protein